MDQGIQLTIENETVNL